MKAGQLHVVPDAPAPHERRLPDLVLTLSAELARTAARAEAFQHVLRLDGLPPDSDALRSMQDLDLLTQELEGLRGFLARLADLLPEGWIVDPSRAVRDITLAGLKARLSGLDPDEADAADDDFEMF